MSQAVTIKSNKTGLTLILDPFMPFNELCIAVCQKFAESADFFRDAKTSIAFEGREVTSQEINMLIECIEANCGLFIAYIQDHDEVKDRQMVAGISKLVEQDIAKTARIVAGPVFSGDTVISDRSVVILGDVKDGATVRAAGNIIITGIMAGKVEAGFANNRNAYIYAGNFETQIIRIGDISQQIDKTGKGRLPFNLPFMKEGLCGYSFSLYDGEITCESFEKGLIKQMIEQ